VLGPQRARPTSKGGERIKESDVRNRPNVTRLLIFLGVVGAAVSIAAAAMHGSQPARAADDVPATVPTAVPVAPGPVRQPVQTCLPGSTGTYVGRHGSVEMLCALSADGSRWQWNGTVQSSDAYAAAGLGATVVDSTGATWVCKLASGGSKLWVWLPQSNTNWHPASASYPAEGVTADS
jgi:hypothetical protein